MEPDEPRYEYRSFFVRSEDGQPVYVPMERLSGLRQSLSVRWQVEARRIGRWEPFSFDAVPGLVRLRQPDSETVHAGVLIDEWRLDSAGATYSTFCGPKTGGSQLLETSERLTCKRCISGNRSPSTPTNMRALIAWHAREIDRLTRRTEL